jgi:hypothetical protein
MDLDNQDIKFFVDQIETVRKEIKSIQRAIARLRRDTIWTGKNK